jgi:hypothetical protein
MEIPPPPPCPPKLKQYLELLRKGAMTNRPIKGRNTSTGTPGPNGTPVNADDCAPCP